MDEIKIVEAGDRDIVDCWMAFSELRKNISSCEEFIRRWNIQKNEGYKIYFIRDDDDGVVAAIGFRIFHTMAWGKILYIDDLIALPGSRGKGLGAALLQYAKTTAREYKCDAVHLDTGYQRHEAHISYLRNGFTLNCHHMECLVND